MTVETVDRHFPPGQARNIGILNGTPSNNILDVDLDCDEARTSASILLPSTGWVFGRQPAPKSHWIYRTETALATAQIEFRDLAGNMLVEMRGTGGQTVVPPSTHEETGERISWYSFTAPADIALYDLQRIVREVAAAALLARHWPAKGSRDTAAMALDGALARVGWAEPRVFKFIDAVATAAGDDEVRMRTDKAGRASAKLEDGRHATGWPTLGKLLGEQGEAVVERVREWLDIAAEPAQAKESPVRKPLPWPAPPGAHATPTTA